MKKSSGTPVLICASGQCPKLERIRLGGENHNEAWLQKLIYDYPQILPIAQIEAGFGVPIPIAREVACGHGYIDNLYLTPAGEIILIETKLWRNVQARREVVAQALDYVSALMVMGYAAFEAEVLKARGQGASLYHLVAEHPEALDEAGFIDAVAQNLARGRMLVIALGDGIRQEAEALAGLLQSHAGALFTFALVELATWRNVETGDILAVPNTLAQTVMIQRGILVFDDGVPLIKAVPAEAPQKAQTLTETMFYEELANRNPAIPGAIRAFLKMVEPLGVYPDLKASLNLKADLPEAKRATNLGYINKNAKLWTDPLAWTAAKDIALRYNEALAQLIGGTVATHAGMYLSTNGSSAPLITDLLPTHAEAWAEAIRRAIDDIRHSEAEAEE